MAEGACSKRQAARQQAPATNTVIVQQPVMASPFGFSPFGFSPFGFSPFGFSPFGFGFGFGGGGFIIQLMLGLFILQVRRSPACASACAWEPRQRHSVTVHCTHHPWRWGDAQRWAALGTIRAGGPAWAQHERLKG